MRVDPSSSMTKKILLVIALNSVLGIDIDATATADITTVSELCEEVAKRYGASVYVRRDLPAAKPIDKAAFVEKMRKKLPKKIAGFKVAEISTLDGVKVYFENDEWLLVRPSGTEPLVRVYAETATKKDTQALLDFGEKLVAQYIK